MPNIGVTELIVIVSIVALVSAVFKIIPYWFIFRKAGFHPALSLLTAIPLLDVVMRFFLAFAEWPSVKKNVD
jgi:hypothetical protein